MKTIIITEKIGDVLWYIPKTLLDLEPNSPDALFRRLKEIGADSFLKNRIDVDSSTTNDMKLHHNVTGKRFNLIKYGRSKQFGSTNFFGEDGKHDVYIKVFTCTSLLLKLKHLFIPSKARREFFLSFKISERGIPAVFSIAVGEKRCFGVLKRSYFIVKKIDNVLNLKEFFYDTELNPLEKHAVLKEFGRTAGLCHRKGILQTDFALNNFLVQRLGNNRFRIYLIDYERTKMCGHVTGKRELWILAKLNRIGSDFSTCDKLRFLRAYLNVVNEGGKRLNSMPEASKLIRDIERETVKILRAGVQEMWTGCIKQHRKFKLYRSGTYGGYYLKGYDADFLISLLDNEENKAYVDEINFNSSSPTISSCIIDNRGGDQCLNYMVYRVKGGTPDFIDVYWQNSNALLKGKIEVLEPLGLFLKVINPDEKNGTDKVALQGVEGFIITSHRHSVMDIKHFFNNLNSTEERKTFFFRLALFICRIHNFGTFVSEICLCDIVVGQNEHNNRYYFLFMHTYNFLLNTSADHKIRWMDIARIVDYFGNEIDVNEADFFRGMYSRYEKWYF